MPEQYESRYAVVRIHEGKRTEAERRQALEESAKRFHIAIEKSKKQRVMKNECFKPV